MIELYPDVTAPTPLTDRVIEQLPSKRQAVIMGMLSVAMTLTAVVGGTERYHPGDGSDRALIAKFSDHYLEGCLAGTPFDPAEGAAPTRTADSPWGEAVIQVPANGNLNEELFLTFNAETDNFTPIGPYTETVLRQLGCDALPTDLQNV
jgi:hypothetical protein